MDQAPGACEDETQGYHTGMLWRALVKLSFKTLRSFQALRKSLLKTNKIGKIGEKACRQHALLLLGGHLYRL